MYAVYWSKKNLTPLGPITKDDIKGNEQKEVVELVKGLCKTCGSQSVLDKGRFQCFLCTGWLLSLIHI